MAKAQELRTLLKPVIEVLGYELVGIEFHRQRGNDLVRIYIDQADGIDLDDCQQVSHQVSGVLEVEDPIPGRYTLEVSSPGLDRPLFELEHFQRFAGQQVKLVLSEPFDGRRKFSGLLCGTNDADIVLEIEQAERVKIPLAHIEKARLVPKL